MLQRKLLVVLPSVIYTFCGAYFLLQTFLVNFNGQNACNLRVGTASAKRFQEARYKQKVASPTQHGSTTEKDIPKRTLAYVQGQQNL